jgi:hypothetical protein
VKNLTDDLMRDAVRSIRQKKSEDGFASVAQIDGVETAEPMRKQGLPRFSPLWNRRLRYW